MRQMITSNVLLLGAVAVLVLIVVLAVLLLQVRAARRGAAGRHAAPEGAAVTAAGRPAPGPADAAATTDPGRVPIDDAATAAPPVPVPPAPTPVRDVGLADLPARYRSLLVTGAAAGGSMRTAAPERMEEVRETATMVDEPRDRAAPSEPVVQPLPEELPAAADAPEVAPALEPTTAGAPQTVPVVVVSDETPHTTAEGGGAEPGPRNGAPVRNAALDAIPVVPLPQSGAPAGEHTPATAPVDDPPADERAHDEPATVEPPPLAVVPFPAFTLGQDGHDEPRRNGVAHHADSRDRLLAVLLDDPAAAVHAVADLDACEVRLERLTAAVRDERAALAEVLHRLTGAGLGPDHLVRLTRLPPDEVREVLAGEGRPEPAAAD